MAMSQIGSREIDAIDRQVIETDDNTGDDEIFERQLETDLSNSGRPVDVQAGAGGHQVVGSAFNDVLRGGSDNDTLIGGRSKGNEDDILVGNEGGDLSALRRRRCDFEAGWH